MNDDADIPLSVLLARRAKRLGEFLQVGDIVTMGFYCGDGQVERLPVAVTRRQGDMTFRGEVMAKPRTRHVRIGQPCVFTAAEVASVEPRTWSESDE